ncbi:bifunctional phosphopantothenoylcysteine decarboxylase/phosphopantothenate--cysteine ligase CoaBC [Kiloniella laminariae]|uniref:Coenzyme A biosynthesis bifunctional protein CoaBC n=1 Tax=Kiloniella laminariae TaxID=454162 RepID=A0ABT4LIQ0_9PROT|nr:bifunctional phosphopantothenoylcysteine decarboxylase/phosphopantothenate--cysteine ligase CoaBC [Kiloniella laminariae]MCZ4280985.1 bifunctional phosphopantothenoylcysteine decarboxylase/phosphopantothenate--cysteine ligase CoaBC [Kiloniella laminariae]
MISGKRVLLVITGGIAAYKSLELIRRLREAGVFVRAVLTKSGAEFVTPLSVSALTGEKTYGELFSLTDETEIGHIQLSRQADLVVVAPATADFLAKMAQGRADDLASTILLATDKDTLVAPSMNVRMWNHPATQENVVKLEQRGVRMVGPNDGDMACGEFGPGRMAEPAEILAAITDYFTPSTAPLQGIQALVTAGPTHEAIDPVRYIANHSSGKQGYAIAAALQKLGANVTLVSGPTNLPCPAGVTRIAVQSALEMLAACEKSLPADIAVCAAAVADWRVDKIASTKLKKTSATSLPKLNFALNPDILASISRDGPNRPGLVIGFAAETEAVEENAKSKLARKGCDWIIANDVSPQTGTFGGDNNTVLLVDQTGSESWETMTKNAVAEKLAQRIVEKLKLNT